LIFWDDIRLQFREANKRKIIIDQHHIPFRFAATANSETKLGNDDGLNASEIVRAKLKSEGKIASRVGQGGTQSRQENVHTSLRAGEGVEQTKQVTRKLQL
jgi:hypothetical protein